VNVLAGLGAAAESGYEEVAALLRDSDRGCELAKFVHGASAVASIKTLAAYGELFDSAYWASRPYRGTENHLSAPCAALADFLIADDRAGVFRRLASQLRVDALKLHRLLELVPAGDEDRDRQSTRRAIGVCHAIRLALFQHMFLRTASIPAYSRINDIAGEEVLEMVLSLRIEDALALLRRAYPASGPRVSDFDLAEPTDFPGGRDGGYDAIHHGYIDPIERAYALALRLSMAIANHFGAHG
jgi:phosphoenolpyruvate carboxylase